MSSSFALVFSIFASTVLGQRQEFQREVTNPLSCPESEQSKDGDTLIVNYKGFLADGKVFDTSEGREPISFVLGEGKVIRGWEKALKRTCPGEDVVMIIPPNLGYGRRGAGGVIPGNATLYFTSTLEGIIRKIDAPKDKSVLKNNGDCKDLKTVKDGDNVTFNTTISLINTKDIEAKLIDTSSDTVKFPKGLIKGWEIGVTGACQGERRQILLGPKLAWGEKGIQGAVPANASVIIDVSVVKVERDLVFNFLNQISSGSFNNGK